MELQHYSGDPPECKAIPAIRFAAQGYHACVDSGRKGVYLTKSAVVYTAKRLMSCWKPCKGVRGNCDACATKERNLPGACCRAEWDERQRGYHEYERSRDATSPGRQACDHKPPYSVAIEPFKDGRVNGNTPKLQDITAYCQHHCNQLEVCYAFVVIKTHTTICTLLFSQTTDGWGMIPADWKKQDLDKSDLKQKWILLGAASHGGQAVESHVPCNHEIFYCYRKKHFCDDGGGTHTKRTPWRHRRHDALDPPECQHAPVDEFML